MQAAPLKLLVIFLLAPQVISVAELRTNDHAGEAGGFGEIAGHNDCLGAQRA